MYRGEAGAPRPTTALDWAPSSKGTTAWSARASSGQASQPRTPHRTRLLRPVRARRASGVLFAKRKEGGRRTLFRAQQGAAAGSDMQYADYLQPDSGSSSYDTLGLSISAEPAAGLAPEDGTNWELALPAVDGSGGMSPAGTGPPPGSSPGPSPTSWQASFSRMEDLLLDLSLGKPPSHRPSVDAAAAAASARAPLGHFEVPWQPTGVRASAEPEGAAPSALNFASSSMSSMSVASICNQPAQPSRIPERMVDKRQARLMNAASFCAAIEEHRANLALSNPTGCDAFALSARAAEASHIDTMGGHDAWGSVAAFVRKRPLLEHEVQKGDFDAATVSADGFSLTAHCCLMKPDLVRAPALRVRFATLHR
eukprot:4493076-Pleurochrysis_carterae.AAC.2